MIRKDISLIVTQAIKSYGIQTIEDRVIPDYRDGLKPVQRRVIWSLYNAKAFSGSSFKKKANIVGDTMKYHPHGDDPISDALTNLVHDRYPLVEGYGSWGDPLYGDPAGAMRYIECRLTKLGECFKERLAVTPFIKNYSGEFQEPLYFEAPVPLYLLNGNAGIAVAVSYCSPPHHAKAVFDAFKALVSNPDISVKNLVKILQGPDYLQGGVLTSSEEDVIEMYASGKGTLTYRCRYHFEEIDGHHVLVITSAAPGIKLNNLLSKLEKLVEQNIIDFVQDTSQKDIRILVGFSNSRSLEKYVLPLLTSRVTYTWALTERHAKGAYFAYTNLKDFMLKWLMHRRAAETAYINYQIDSLNKLIREKEILLLIAQNIERLTACLKAKDSKASLMKAYNLTEEEANFVLSRSLSSFTRQSKDRLQQEIKQARQKVKELKAKLNDIDSVILEEMRRWLEPYFKEDRLTLIREEDPSIPEVGESGLLCFKKDAKTWVETPPKHTRLKADFIAPVISPFVVITEEGRGRTFQYPDLKALQKYKKRIAGVAQEADYVALLDNHGKLLIVPFNKLGNREKQIFKTTGKVISVQPLWEGQSLYFVTSRDIKTLSFNQLERFVANPGTAGKKVKWKSVTHLIPEINEEAIVLAKGARKPADAVNLEDVEDVAFL